MSASVPSRSRARLEGCTLGRYELLLHLSSGGMGEVYLGRAIGEAGFERLVAIKCMLPDRARLESNTTMFFDEARMAAHVQSPFVVSTLDLGTSEDGTHFIAMEFVYGLSLAELRHARERHGERWVPIEVAMCILSHAAHGLHDAHEARTVEGTPLDLVHRDISPHNILVGADGLARITDFGIARATLRDHRTRTGKMKGKFGYCSPEQAEGIEVDRRSDVFSLGVVAWELLSGERLFDAPHPLAMLRQLCEADIPSLSRIRPEITDEVAAVIERALCRDRDQRFDSAHAFLETLTEACRRSGIAMGSRECVSSYVRAVGAPALSRLQEDLKAKRRVLASGGSVAPLDAFRASTAGAEAAAMEGASMAESESIWAAPGETRDDTHPDATESTTSPSTCDFEAYPDVSRPDGQITAGSTRGRSPLMLRRLPWVAAVILMGATGAAIVASNPGQETSSESSSMTASDTIVRTAQATDGQASNVGRLAADAEALTRPTETKAAGEPDVHDVSADSVGTKAAARTRVVRRVKKRASRRAKATRRTGHLESEPSEPLVPEPTRQADPQEPNEATQPATRPGLRGLDAFDRDLRGTEP